ncbi:MAG: hypothetical protein RIT35_896 [Pseudomonadota bacterium]|jgi:hypothetical protein
MVELVDTLASGASERKLVEVQILFSVPQYLQILKYNYIQTIFDLYFAVSIFEPFQIQTILTNFKYTFIDEC